MDLLVGIDVGTNATKALLLDLKGNPVAFAEHGYGLITPRDGWVEQDPEDLWRGVVETCRRLSVQLQPGDRISALSISSQGGTTIPVDGDMRPLRNAISWMDRRAHEQAEHVRRAIGDEEVYRRTGWKLQDGLPLQHIAWLRDNEPDLFRSTRYFLFVNDFILYRLTGRLCMDPSDAGITQLYNLAERRWDERLAKIAGIEIDQLSPIQPPGTAVGTLTREASEETGLPSSTLVVNGAHDQYCAALGVGVLEPGSIMLSCGTAWVVLGVFEKLNLDPESVLSVSPHVIPDLWGGLYSLGAVGASMEWFSKDICRSEGYDEINYAAARSPVGSNGLIFVPLTGGHAQTKRGTFFGLSLSHSLGDLARSVMEGIAFELRWVMEKVRKAGMKADQFKMVGGAAESTIWPQIVADVTDIPVVLPKVKQAASYGAAVLAGVGGGLYPDVKYGSDIIGGEERRLMPDRNNAAQYDKLFELYRTVFEGIGKYLGV